MRLVRLTGLLIVTAMLVVVPVLHSHPLLAGSDDGDGLSSHSICAICAVGAASAVLSAVVVVAPVLVIEQLAAAKASMVSLEVPLALAARAPPAA